jgi:hypothetical protein
MGLRNNSKNQQQDLEGKTAATTAARGNDNSKSSIQK